MWRFSGGNEYRRRLEHLDTEESVLAASSDASARPEQQLTPFTRLSDEEVGRVNCVYGMKPNPGLIPAMEQGPGYAEWLNAVRAFQQLNRSGQYRILFFVNDVPPICPDGDVFYDGGSQRDRRFLPAHPRRRHPGGELLRRLPARAPVADAECQRARDRQRQRRQGGGAVRVSPLAACCRLPLQLPSWPPERRQRPRDEHEDRAAAR